MGPWSVEQVLAVAPARTGAARPLAVPALWDGTGCDDRVVWGRFRGGSGEPYQTMVDHAPGESVGGSVGERLADVGARCTCPSRVTPCKHAVALMLVWANGHVPTAARPAAVESWVHHRDTSLASRRPAPTSRSTPDPVRPGPTVAGADSGPSGGGTPPAGRPERNEERLHRVTLGLRELERWIDDRVRVGLGDPSIARYATWDELATRLVDAQAGSLANRVRRLAGHVGARPGWHEHVLAELGVLHLLARAGEHLADLDGDWADSVAAAVGFTVKQADVRAGVPETADWAVMGRSDVVEDRIVVRRLWLRATGPDADRDPRAARTGGWAVLLSFAAYGQSLDDSLPVGTVVRADLHRYPGAVPLRALLGDRHDGDRHDDGAARRVAAAEVAAPSVAAALDHVGTLVAREPWIERVPVTLTGTPAVVEGTWMLADHTGALPLADAVAGGSGEIATLLAASAGAPVTVTAEWTPLGMVLLTVHGDDRDLDIGPRGGFR